MLVCNVSLRPPRSAIAATIAEAAAALDDLGSGSGQVVFATLVDDPASVGEIVDAYLGEIMLEAASANAVADSGLVYSVLVDEIMTATDTQDATKTASTTATWDAATVTAVTLSGGNLVATNTGTTSASQGAHVASALGLTSGKFYFESTWTTKSGVGGGNISVGVGTTASTYTGIGGSATTGTTCYFTSGNVWSNGSSAGVALTAVLQGEIVGVAVDLDNRKFWVRKSPSGNWNASGTANPATNTGGFTIPAGTMIPFITFGGSSGTASNVITTNFGASTFTGSVPSGFTSGWPG